MLIIIYYFINLMEKVQIRYFLVAPQQMTNQLHNVFIRMGHTVSETFEPPRAHPLEIEIWPCIVHY